MLAAVLVALATPARAVACAVCLGAAFGDRSYTWPYLGLILMPFIVAGAVVGAVVWHFGWRPRHLVARPTSRLSPRTETPSPRTQTETT